MRGARGGVLDGLAGIPARAGQPASSAVRCAGGDVDGRPRSAAATVRLRCVIAISHRARGARSRLAVETDIGAARSVVGGGDTLAAAADLALTAARAVGLLRVRAVPARRVAGADCFEALRVWRAVAHDGIARHAQAVLARVPRRARILIVARAAAQLVAAPVIDLSAGSAELRAGLVQAPALVELACSATNLRGGATSAVDRPAAPIGRDSAAHLQLNAAFRGAGSVAALIRGDRSAGLSGTASAAIRDPAATVGGLATREPHLRAVSGNTAAQVHRPAPTAGRRRRAPTAVHHVRATVGGNPARGIHLRTRPRLTRIVAALVRCAATAANLADGAVPALDHPATPVRGFAACELQLGARLGNTARPRVRLDGRIRGGILRRRVR